MSEYTAQEIATLQSRLDKQLGPEFISSRPGAAGQKVHYLSADKVISLANEVFGFNGWSSAIQNIQIDFVDENVQSGKISLGLSVIVRVTLKDGTFHEDIGYGHIENCKGKAAAFEKAKKEGTTDALKRALRTFGNVVGNCVYDKDYVAKVTKLKYPAPKWDADNLHRHSDFVRVKKEEPEGVTSHGKESRSNSNASFDDDFDMADLDEADFAETADGHPDEVVLPANNAAAKLRPPPNRPVSHMPERQPSSANGQSRTNGNIAPSRAPQLRQPAAQNGPAPQSMNRPQPAPAAMHPPSHFTNQYSRNPHPSNTVNAPPPQASDFASSSSPGQPSQHFEARPAGHGQQTLPSDHVPPVGFVSAKASMPNVPKDAALAFNPHAESPSIPKTPGVDHTKSVPIKRKADAVDEAKPTLRHEGPQQQGQSAQTAQRDFVNPQNDLGRRVGVPNMQSPLRGGASGYRPPTRHGPTTSGVMYPPLNPAPAGPPSMAAPSRQPLNDISNQRGLEAGGSSASAAPDAKRQRLPLPGADQPQRNMGGML